MKIKDTKVFKRICKICGNVLIYKSKDSYQNAKRKNTVCRKCSKTIDLSKKKFNQLFVLKFSEYRNKRAHWKCLCDCGNKVTVSSSNLINGHTKSCGCYLIEKNSTHGLSKHELYQTHNGMIQRCYNKRHIKYKNYGGRGIIVCNDWKGISGLQNFINDMYNKLLNHKLYKIENLTLDRINNDAEYSSKNCKWSTDSEQNLNKRKYEN